MSKSEYLYSVRPALAAAVRKAGGEALDAENYIQPLKHAWSIRLDRISLPVIQSYYAERNLELPAQVRAYIEAHKEG